MSDHTPLHCSAAHCSPLLPSPSQEMKQHAWVRGPLDVRLEATLQEMADEQVSLGVSAWGCKYVRPVRRMPRLEGGSPWNDGRNSSYLGDSPRCGMELVHHTLRMGHRQCCHTRLPVGRVPTARGSALLRG